MYRIGWDKLGRKLLGASRTVAGEAVSGLSLTDTLEKPDTSIAQGSGHKPIMQFVPAAELLQSNQIAEHTYCTDILTSGENTTLCYS